MVRLYRKFGFSRLDYYNLLAMVVMYVHLSKDYRDL